MPERVKSGIEKTKFLIDTDVLINHIRNKSYPLLVEITSKTNIIISISVLNKFELYRGIDNAKDKENADELIAYFELYPVTELIADKAAEIGKISNIAAGPVDILLAATCVINNLILVTDNKKHFKNIPGLVIYNGKC